jgi:hypothetical protein
MCLPSLPETPTIQTSGGTPKEVKNGWERTFCQLPLARPG